MAVDPKDLLTRDDVLALRSDIRRATRRVRRWIIGMMVVYVLSFAALGAYYMKEFS